MTMRRWWLVLLVVLAPWAQAASVHAFLDRTQASLGDTVTLNIQSDGTLENPDLSPLQKDFEVLGTSRSRSVQIVNGKTTSTAQLGVALKPLRAGTLAIPALDVGGGTTQPLTLHVGAAPSGGTGSVGDPVFMEAGVQTSSPWVGQQTVYTVRLFYLPGVDGALGDPSADGARLMPLDRDRRYMTERNGYTYKVIERSWALIPQRAGAINIQGPGFQGQRLGSGIPNALLNDPQALLNNPGALLHMPLRGFGEPARATAPVVRIDARTPPSNAGKPWLPARDVELKLSGVPADGRVNAGTPLTITLAITAAGQPADALPEPELPPIAGARVYPDQTRDATDDHGEWLQGTRTRSFAIVPNRDGALTIPAITLNWWDVGKDRAEQASVPSHILMVSGVTGNAAAQAAPPAAATVNGPAGGRGAAGLPVTVDSGAHPPWRLVALASLAAWLLVVLAVLAWWISSRRRRPVAVQGARAAENLSGEPMGQVVAGNAVQPPPATDTVNAPPSARVLQKQSLDAARAGDAAATEHALLAWARALRPGISHAGALRALLSDPAQLDALDALQRARWHGGNATSACSVVAQAFAHGFVWRDDAKSTHDRDDDALPPLYPS